MPKNDYFNCNLCNEDNIVTKQKEEEILQRIGKEQTLADVSINSNQLFRSMEVQ